MQKRSFFNILCIVIGLLAIVLAFISNQLTERLILGIAGAVCVYVGISSLRIKS